MPRYRLVVTSAVVSALAFFPVRADAHGPIVENDVIRLMEQRPDDLHPLIVAVSLDRAPIDLEAMLPTTAETNACTQCWAVWDDLRRRKETGEDVSDEAIAQAQQEARSLDQALCDKQANAYLNYQADYDRIVAESVPRTFESLRVLYGERVRRVAGNSQLLLILLDRAELEELRAQPGIEHIAYDVAMGPMLDKSRKNILAHKVQCPDTGTGYKGAGVKVAIVDDGIQLHNRLPGESARIQRDFSTDNDACRDPDNGCTAGHGTQVAGVVFCQPNVEDPCTGGIGYDQKVGIAYQASLVNAKLTTLFEIGCGYPPGCAGEYEEETWSRTMNAFKWALTDSTGALSHVLNYSRGQVAIGTGDTLASALYSKNVDWLVYTSGGSFVHSCGNTDRASELSPPSGAYNLLSVGSYNDNDADESGCSNNRIADTTSPGPTDDHRRKPDLCAPEVKINTTHLTSDFLDVYGTSYAAPHVAGVNALLKEARSSLNPREAHAILVNSTDFALLPEGSRQTGWDDQGGWGMLNAQNAVLWRNFIKSDVLADPSAVATYELSNISASEAVVITGVWHRSMVSETGPTMDPAGHPSPANLDLVLESRPLSGGVWSVVDSTIGDYDGNDGFPEDNVRQVRGAQDSSASLKFRVRVEHNPTSDSGYQLSQTFTIASRHAFLAP